MEKILIFVETRGDEVRKVSLELLNEGKRITESGRFEVEAIVMGPVSASLRSQLLSRAARVVQLTDEVLRVYTPEAYSLALASYSREAKPTLILGGATRIGRDFMPRVAVLLGCGIASDVTAANWAGEPMTFVRPVHGGRVLSEMSFCAYPGIVTTRPNSFAIGAAGEEAGEFVERKMDIPGDQIRTRVVGVEETVKGKVDLTEAEIIVSGGHGMKGPENFGLLEDLAQVMGGVVGATRSVVDAKWRDTEDQVGKSGKTVSPKLYIAAGISGAIHHIMGMDTSKLILAINKDENANIFNYADYGIVGDLFEVVPAMTAELKKKLGK